MSPLRLAAILPLFTLFGCDACNHEPVPFGLNRAQVPPTTTIAPSPSTLSVTTLATSTTEFSIGDTHVRGDGIVFAAKIESPTDTSPHAIYVELRDTEWKLREYRSDGSASATRDIASLTNTPCPVGSIELSAIDASTVRLDFRECVAFDGPAELQALATPRQSTVILRVRGPAREIERISWRLDGSLAAPPTLAFRDADNDGNTDLEIAFTEPPMTLALRAQTNGFVAQSVHEQLMALHRRVRETRNGSAAATLSHQVAQLLAAVCRESGAAQLQVGSHVGIPCGARIRNQLVVQNAIMHIRAGATTDGWLEAVLQLRALMAQAALSDTEKNQLTRAISDASLPALTIENLEVTVSGPATLQRTGATFDVENATSHRYYTANLDVGEGVRSAEPVPTDAPIDGSNGYRLVSVREVCGSLRVDLAKGDALGEAPVTRWFPSAPTAGGCQVAVDPIRSGRFTARYPQGPYVVLALGVSGVVVARGREKIFVPTAGDAPPVPYLLAADAPFPEPLQNWALARDRQSYAFSLANLVVRVSFAGALTVYRIPPEVMHDRTDVNISVDDTGLIWVHGEALYRGTATHE